MANRDGEVGVVMTMGALHDGHRELIQVARRRCEVVVVTVFLNPLQFAPSEDLSRYPKTLDADVALCARGGRRRRLRAVGRGGLPRRPAAGAGARRPARRRARGRVPAGALRRRADRGGQAAAPDLAGRRVLRPEGRPAAAAHLADGRTTSTSRSRSCRCRRCATPTGSRCRAATPTSPTPTIVVALTLSRALFAGGGGARGRGRRCRTPGSPRRARRRARRRPRLPRAGRARPG